VKATAGGGGKGMKVATKASEFAAALVSARREARSAFGDDRVLLERYLAKPRHIEIQVFADTQGHALHLFERDCSVQRRHQKVIEEAPAPGMDEARRHAMGEAAVAAAKAIGYVGAGTVEFIAEQDGTFYFMEMNTRLQVEHPVTEMITGCDLVEWQLRVASGAPLPTTQADLAIHGHAIEARLYAEDPARDFLPSIGRIGHWRMPDDMPNVRVDTGYRAGDEVTPFYDPMLAKVIAFGEDRERARQTLLAALARCEVTGVTTNAAFLERVVEHETFASGRVDTGLIADHREALLPAAPPAAPDTLIAAAVAEYRAVEAALTATAARSSDPYSPWNAADAWWNGTSTHHAEFAFRDGEREHRVTVAPRGDTLAIGDGAFARDVRVHVRDDRLCIERLVDGVVADAHEATVVFDGDVRHVFVPGARHRLALVDPLAETDDVERGGHLVAPMSGTIVAVLVAPGERVEKGAPLVVLEAMKMEHTIVAPAAGRVAAIHFGAGDRVGEGADLVDVEQAEELCRPELTEKLTPDKAFDRRWALTVYLTLAALIFLGILSQGFLIGALLFAGAGWAGNAHATLGLIVLILALLLPLTGLLARLPSRQTILSAVLFLLTLIQVILPNLSGSLPFAAALHPTNAMLLFGLTLLLLNQGWRIRQWGA